MSTPFEYSTTYVLDKSHFSETFDESVTLEPGLRPYTKAAVFVLLGTALLVSEFNGYLAWFFVAIGVLEALSVRFKKPWWLARQMLSRAANSKLTLKIDEGGVSSKSFYVDSRLAWQDITRIEETTRGWLLYQGKGRVYVSKRCLSAVANDFIRAKAEALAA